MTHVSAKLWIALIALLAILPAVPALTIAKTSNATAQPASEALIVISRGSDLVLTPNAQRMNFSGATQMVCTHIVNVGVASVGYDCRRI
ncbi:MAG: hypothetical protein AAFR23_00715 [Pseudomonadota bacterium]